MSVNIRKFAESDRQDCRSLWRELAEWHREIYQDQQIGGNTPEDFFDRHLSIVGPERIWVAELGSKIVGLVGLVVKDDEAEIEPIIVSRPNRNRGIGSQLVRTVVSEAKRIGVKYLDVSPLARNSKTIGFFWKLGFVNIGHINLFVDFKNRSWKSGIDLFGYSFNY